MCLLYRRSRGHFGRGQAAKLSKGELACCAEAFAHSEARIRVWEFGLEDQNFRIPIP